MCGIAGKIYWSGEARVRKDDIHRMNDRIKHRGPDDEGIYINPTGNVGLGHRRLAIIDLSPAGHQPMSNEDGTIWIVFNGEIYNFQSLRPDLEAKGHKFKSSTDTEVIIHLWEEHKEGCLQYLRGMFAFAIWDERKKMLFLARDRVGKKPLKYFIGKNFIVFASELKAFLPEQDVPCEVDYEAIHHYLTFQYVPTPMTGFLGIKKLPPAHYLTVNLSGDVPRISKPTRYWHLNFENKLNIKKEEWRERIVHALDECVKIRMISDVPLGAFLSGGVDSSAVVAFMARHSAQPVKTFSIGFKEQSHNELPYAQMIARQYATDHTEFIVEPNALEVLPDLIYHYEEPYADSSALPTYYVSKLTREHVTVALNGDGGDENFAGYPWYPIHRFAHYWSRLPYFIQQCARTGTRLTGSVIKNTFTNRAIRFVNGAGETPEVRYLRYFAYFHPEEKATLYTPEFRLLTSAFDSKQFFLRYFQESEASDLLDRALYTDINSYLPDDLLVKVDIASMAVSLEARSPFLDHKFMELAAQIPSSLKLHGREKKYIFKLALEGIIPHANLYRRKMGFGVPIEHWFRGPLKKYIQETLTDPQSLPCKLFNRASLNHLIAEHQHTHISHAYRLWSLLTLELWWRAFWGKPPSLL